MSLPRSPEDTRPVWRRPLEQGIWLVGVRGRLDHSSVPDLESTLGQLVGGGHIQLVVDLSQATYVNSGGLRTLVSTWRAARRAGGDLHLCGLSSRLQEIFQMVGFDQLFEIHSAPADAVRSLTLSRDA